MAIAPRAVAHQVGRRAVRAWLQERNYIVLPGRGDHAVLLDDEVEYEHDWEDDVAPTYEIWREQTRQWVAVVTKYERTIYFKTGHIEEHGVGILRWQRFMDFQRRWDAECWLCVLELTPVPVILMAKASDLDNLPLNEMNPDDSWKVVGAAANRYKREWRRKGMGRRGNTRDEHMVFFPRTQFEVYPGPEGFMPELVAQDGGSQMSLTTKFDEPGGPRRSLAEAIRDVELREPDFEAMRAPEQLEPETEAIRASEQLEQGEEAQTDPAYDCYPQARVAVMDALEAVALAMEVTTPPKLVTVTVPDSITISLDPRTIIAVQWMAEQQNRSVGELVEESIRLYLVGRWREA